MRATFATRREVAAFRRALLGHYDRFRRSLPWRDEHDPYRILVSEVMLQQTRVETVLDYYGRWLERFPDVRALAEADEDEVLKAWEGLGYYRRARNLHRAARIVRERPGGALPATYEELRALPGLGEYTAGAVASIAFGEPVPAADGNVRRVLARLHDVRAPSAAWVRRRAAALLDPERPGDWNQAVMELGAMVCTPRQPRCEACPVRPWCSAHARGTQERRPASTKRGRPRSARFALAVLHDGMRVLVVRRPRGGLLGGLWALPERPVDGAKEAADAATAIAAELGVRVDGAPEPLPPLVHRFTHLQAEYFPHAVRAQEGAAERANVGTAPKADSVARDDLAWIDTRAPLSLALPTAQRRVLDSFRRAAPVLLGEERPRAGGVDDPLGGAVTPTATDAAASPRA